MTRQVHARPRAAFVVCRAFAVPGILLAAPAVAALRVPPLDTAAVANPRCIDTVTPRRFERTTIYQREVSSDTTPAVAAQLDLISQRVAEVLRAALGARPNGVPDADTLADWRHVTGELPLELVLHRDQPSTWRADSTATSAPTKLANLYLAVLRGSDDLWIVWPPGLASDSLVVRFSLWANDPKRPTDRAQFAVFSILMGIVPETPVLNHRRVEPRYPYDAETHSVIATLTMDFVVDTTGRADPATVTDVPPPPGSFDFSGAQQYYREFVDAARKAVLGSTFYPARRGGCPVRMRVRVPYQFRFHH